MQYLLNMYHPQDQVPSAEELEPVMQALGALNAEMQQAGAWVFTAPLTPASSATVVSTLGDEVITTDGPFTEAKEQLGGLWLIEAPDLDAALGWARRITGITTLPIEIRPVVDYPGR